MRNMKYYFVKGKKTDKKDKFNRTQYSGNAIRVIKCDNATIRINTHDMRLRSVDISCTQSKLAQHTTYVDEIIREIDRLGVTIHHSDNDLNRFMNLPNAYVIPKRAFKNAMNDVYVIVTEKKLAEIPAIGLTNKYNDKLGKLKLQFLSLLEQNQTCQYKSIYFINNGSQKLNHEFKKMDNVVPIEVKTQGKLNEKIMKEQEKYCTHIDLSFKRWCKNEPIKLNELNTAIKSEEELKKINEKLIEGIITAISREQNYDRLLALQAKKLLMSTNIGNMQLKNFIKETFEARFGNYYTTSKIDIEKTSTKNNVTEVLLVDEKYGNKAEAIIESIKKNEEEEMEVDALEVFDEFEIEFNDESDEEINNEDITELLFEEESFIKLTETVSVFEQDFDIEVETEILPKSKPLFKIRLKEFYNCNTNFFSAIFSKYHEAFFTFFYDEVEYKYMTLDEDLSFFLSLFGNDTRRVKEVKTVETSELTKSDWYDLSFD